MVRVLTVLKEYINECDSDYHEERTILPMSRCRRNLTESILRNIISDIIILYTPHVFFTYEGILSIFLHIFNNAK